MAESTNTHAELHEQKPNEEKEGLQVEALARLPERTIVDETQLAQILCVTPRTIRRMVLRFELPPPVPLAGRSVWLAGRILAHIDAAADRAEREAKREEQRGRAMTL